MSYSDLAAAVQGLNATNQELVESILDFQVVTKVANYAALRNYKGLANRIEVTQSGIMGTFQDLGITGDAEINGMVIVGFGGRVWGRVYDGLVESSWFETKGDNIKDDTVSFQTFWSFLSAFGLDGHVKAGKYKISNQCLTTLTNSFGVYCDANVEFVAALGFPSAAAIFALGNALVPNRTFKWIGGRFDGKNQPYTSAGSGSGCALLTVNAYNCSHCHIELDRTYTGDDWLNSGGDSHLFIGGPRNIYARVYEAIGAPDSAIYVSRNFAGTIGESLDVDGNFYKCAVGVIVKRQFETAKVNATGIDCVTVAAVGQADITGFASTNGGSGYIFEVNAKRCQYPLFLQSVRAVRGVVNVDKLGVSITGFKAADASGVRLRGTKDSQIEVNISGMHPDIVADANFVGAYFGPITNDKDGNVDSTGNHIIINARGIGCPFVEAGSGTNNNMIWGKFDASVTNLPVIVGVDTKYELQVGNLKLMNTDFRKLNNAGNIVWSLSADGSMSFGARGTGVASPAYMDGYSSGNANRDGRIILTGGTSVVDNAVMALQAGQVTLSAPAVDCTGVIRPAVTLVGTVGQASRVWNGGFTQTAFTVTSDENFKTEIGDIEELILDAWSKVNYQHYKLTEAVELKGDGARWHFGVIAQRVRDAFESVGIDPFSVGILCFDKWDAEPAVLDDEGNIVSHEVVAGERYSIRYEEALVLEAALMRRISANLQERLLALENKA